MEEFFGTLLVKAIPWLIPFILFCSWVMNWKGDTPKKGGDGEPKEKKPKAEKKEASQPPPDSEE